MSKIIRKFKKKFARMERGQVLVIVAAAAIGVIAMIGLVMDVGLMFIGNARLRRAVDAAALASALQYREGYSLGSLTDAANELLVINGFTNPSSTIYTCNSYAPPADMDCALTSQRKLVEVHSTADVKLAFLPVIGIDSVPISATAISETASLDVVLVIDRSESMTYTDAAGNTLTVGDPMRDPFYCNQAALYSLPATDSKGNTHISGCHPFFEVISSAIDFTDILFFPYDQMSIVTFDKDPGVPKDASHNCLPANLVL